VFVQTEANEVVENQTTRTIFCLLSPSISSSITSLMAPRIFPAPQLKPSTRSKNKDAHPGQPVIDATQTRRSRQEMEEVRAKQAQEQEEEKKCLEKNLKAAAQIEDELLQEDIQRRTSNRQSQGIAPFKPPLAKEVPLTGE
jgi:hypothetical protein